MAYKGNQELLKEKKKARASRCYFQHMDFFGNAG
jgi:hypothetical protein